MVKRRGAQVTASELMTALLLLAYINAALLLQLGVGVGVWMWRRRRAAVNTPAAAQVKAARVSSGAWPGWRKFRVARREFEDAARSQCSFHLEPVDGAPLPPFKPGQFLTFALQVADTSAAATGGQRAITRCYSLSDRPQPPSYRVTIKRVPAPADQPNVPPGASSSHFHDRVREGDVLEVKAPSGHFFIDPDPNVPAVLVAGGIGITPMMSMLRWCLAEQPGRTVRLYYGVRNGDEHAFKAVLGQLAASQPNFHLNAVYSRPGPNDLQGRDYLDAGHVDVDLLRRTLPHGRHQFYICGPAPMMESLVPALVDWGVPKQDIHFEAFGPASVRLAPAGPPAAETSVAAPVEVRFSRSGRTLVWDGRDESLLDFAERHGVAVDSGCRSGSCGSCETKLVSGSVGYANPPDHDIAAGHCLLCVGTPSSVLVLEA